MTEVFVTIIYGIVSSAIVTLAFRFYDKRTHKNNRPE